MTVEATLQHLSVSAREFLRTPQRIFVGGSFVDAPGVPMIEVFDPASASVIAAVPDCGANEIDRAVNSARAALRGPWRNLRPADRERMLLKLADLFEADGETLAQIESLNSGKSIGLSRAIEVGISTEYLRYMAGWATKIEGQTLDSSIAVPPGSRYLTYTLREPVGVVGAIIPWNFPLLEAMWKVAPSLAAGCTIVLKPSEETPLTALRLAQLCKNAGIPDGVVNVVTGCGETAGTALINHPGVDKLSFTGSTATGKLIGHAAVEGLKRFTLELGGKSPMLLFADMDAGQEQLLARLGMFFNQGQVCTAGTRVLIERNIYDRTLESLGKVADSLVFGPGLDPAAEINPVVSSRQRERVQGFLTRARTAGAKFASGERGLPDRGYYVAPTLLYDVKPEMEVVRDEVFGPVIVAMPFDDEEEAVALANDTRYGLSASVWTSNLNRAMRVTRQIQAGTVWVNSHNVLDPNLPFGGFKQSGIGREHGRAGIDSYLETKTVMIRYS